jgi:hypothetical protein
MTLHWYPDITTRACQCLFRTLGFQKAGVPSWQVTPAVAVDSKVPAEAVIVATVIILIVGIVAGSKAPFIAVAGTLIILSAAVQRCLVASSLVEH